MNIFPFRSDREELWGEKWMERKLLRTLEKPSSGQEGWKAERARLSDNFFNWRLWILKGTLMRFRRKKAAFISYIIMKPDIFLPFVDAFAFYPPTRN